MGDASLAGPSHGYLSMLTFSALQQKLDHLKLLPSSHSWGEIAQILVNYTCEV